MEELDTLTHRPTAARPLLGQTILLVEDSLFSCDAIRLLALRSGARIRRADRLASARRHLAVYRPSVAIIDFGLPDGSGAELLRDLAQTQPRVDVILATSGDPELQEAAFKTGADDFIAKPIHSLAAFQNVILKHLPDNRKPRGVRRLNEDSITPDPISLRDDLDHIVNLLSQPDPSLLPYAAQFLGSLGRSADRADIARISETLRAASDPKDDKGANVAQAQTALRGLLAQTSPATLGQRIA